jgi:hypothetical protein
MFNLSQTSRTFQNIVTLVIITIFSLHPLKAQKVPQYEYFEEGSVKIIPPTYLNLAGLVLCEEQTFIKGMKSYGYNVTYNYSDSFYEATVWSNKCLYSIRKRGYQVWAMFTPDQHEFAKKTMSDLDKKGLSSTNLNGVREYNIVVRLGNEYQCNLLLSAKTNLAGNTSLIHVRVKK